MAQSARTPKMPQMSKGLFINDAFFFQGTLGKQLKVLVLLCKTKFSAKNELQIRGVSQRLASGDNIFCKKGTDWGGTSTHGQGKSEHISTLALEFLSRKNSTKYT